MSSAALALLDDRERELVLGHERRHLRARHDLALAYSGALARTFPWVSLFAMAHAQIAVLLEMAADDAAATPADRRALAGAIVALGTGIRPETALAASDTAALIRVRRLTSTTRTTRPRAYVRRGSRSGTAPVPPAGPGPGASGRGRNTRLLLGGRPVDPQLTLSQGVVREASSTRPMSVEASTWPTTRAATSPFASTTTVLGTATAVSTPRKARSAAALSSGRTLA